MYLIRWNHKPSDLLYWASNVWYYSNNDNSNNLYAGLIVCNFFVSNIGFSVKLLPLSLREV